MPLSEDPVTAPGEVFAALPDPAQADSLAGLVERLRRLKIWAGDPSYETIKDRVNAAWAGAGRPASERVGKSTVAYCFRPGRRRLDTELVVAVVRALHPDAGYVTQWRQALRVVGGETEAVSQVRVRDSLPQDLAGFSGRTRELDQLYQAVQGGQAVVISAIEGMAGVGKTQLAVHAAHMLHRRQPFERVLFVNLRGFDPDPAQPPADPGAVLDGFLRLLGMPGQQIPHALDARAGAYRDRLAGTRTLVVLDNAATTTQIRPLLPAQPGCPTLITSRRRLTGLQPATHLTVDVFTPGEALAFLLQAVPETPVGPDPHAASRIARRCGYLPLALSLAAGHIRNTPGWTLTDHADRLDERHHQRRLDTGVELALALSYQHLPDDPRRLLRLLALHPGQDFDVYAAAALADTDLATARALLESLHRDHLLQHAGPGRYIFHDLIHAYATTRTQDEDRPSDRRTALSRLLDHYLAATATAINTLHPAEAHHRPAIPPAATPTPDLTDPGTAVDWLDTERPTLVAVVAYAATDGWHTCATRLARTLFPYLRGGHNTDAVTVHGHAHQAGRRSGEPIQEAHALTDLSVAESRLGRYGPAAQHLQQALELFRQTGDRTGEARALNNAGTVEHLAGRYRAATDRYRQALTLYRQTGDRTGEARALANLGNVEGRLGRHRSATDHYAQALTLYRQAGDRAGEALTLNNLGSVEVRLGRYGPGGDHLRQALTLHRHLGDRNGEGSTLDSLGTLHLRLGQPAQAAERYRQALAIARENRDLDTEVWALNGLGESLHAEGRHADAATHHRAAHTIAADIGDREQRARAHTGLGHAYHALGNLDLASEHYQHALILWTDLDRPEATEIRDRLGTLAAACSAASDTGPGATSAPRRA